MLQYSLEERSPAWVVRFDGDLSGTDDKELRKLFVDLAEDRKQHVVANMENVGFLDSVVLGTLVWGMKNLRERDGDFRLCHLQAFVQRLFHITQLETAFQIYDSEADAVASYRA